VTGDSGRGDDGGNGPAQVTVKASSVGTRPTTHGSLSGSVHRVASASALAALFSQFVSFVGTIGLARLLTPTDVGIFVAGTVLSALLTNFVEGGLQAGLVQRQRDLADADETVFRVTLMVGAAASLGCLAAAPVIGIIFNSGAAGLVAAATAGVVLIHSLTNVPEAVLQREFSVKRRLIVGPAIAVSYAAVSVGLAALGWGVWSMVAGMYASYIAWVVSLWMITSWRPGRGHASLAMWRELARYGFPLVFAMIGFRLRTAVESLVVGRFLSTGALGFFRYGQRIALIPEMGIIQVGSITLFPAFSRIAGDRKRFATAYLRALHWSMVAAAVGTGLMIAVGAPAVVVLFGERWRGAGVALVAMSGVSIGAAIAVVAQDVIKAHGRTRLINWFTLADLFLGVGFLLVLTWAFGFVGASLYLSPTILVDAVILLGLAQQLVIVPLRRVLTVLATPIPGLLIATMATWWLEHEILRADSRGPILAVTLLAVDVLVFCLIYLAVLTLFARSTVITIVRIVPVLIKRIAPAIDRGFEGRALMDGAAGSALVVGATAILLPALVLVKSRVPGGLGALLLLVVVGAIIVAACLRYPPLSVVILLGAMFLRLALPHLIVADPFLIAYALVVVAAAVWIWQHRHALPRVTFVEVAMALYTLWCYGSMVLPHQYPPVEYPLDGQLTAVSRFIELSAIIPFTMYLLGRRLFARESAVRFVLWSILGFAAYSVLVSICQFSAPSLVWPRYIVRAPNWPGRAVGVFNQPVGNGMVLIIGFVIAIVLASDRGEPTWRRALLWLYTLPSALAIYFTHTRAIYLAFVLVLILGVILASGARAVFAGLLGAIALLVALNWSTFTSSDRAAGGVDSKGEVWDRLNACATSIWAFKREPWFGWGISRFVAVNSYDHQQWSNGVPWVRGLGIASHETELGILVELGLLGLLLWLCVLVPIIGLLVQAYWILPSAGVTGRRLAFVAISALGTQLVAGAFADLRLIDGPTCMVFLICGVAVGARDRELAARRPRPPLWLSTLTLPDRAAPGRAATRPSAVPVGAA
jgi:O-antigen/teichoic acid export membrane protein/O-antigen ligase